MTRYLMIPISFSLLISSFLISSCSNIILHTCKEIAENDPNVRYDFCVASLEADAKSQNVTSLEELGVVCMELSISNATYISSYISQLLGTNQSDTFARRCLEDCLELYTDAVATLNDAISYFKARDYGTTNIEVSSAMDASTTCEDGFGDREGEVSPLTMQNGVFFELTAIALAFTKFSE